MRNRCFAIVIIFALTSAGAAAQQPVRLSLASGSMVDGILTRVDDDSLQILRRIEVTEPFKHERDIPFTYALRDVTRVGMTAGQTAGDVTGNSMMYTALGITGGLGITYVLSRNSGGGGLVELDAAVGVVILGLVVVGVMMAFGGDESGPTAWYDPGSADQLGALKIMTSSATGEIPHKAPASASIWARAKEILEIVRVQLHDGTEIDAYLYSVSDSIVTVLSSDDDFTGIHDGREIGSIAVSQIASISPKGPASLLLPFALCGSLAGVAINNEQSRLGSSLAAAIGATAGAAVAVAVRLSQGESWTWRPEMDDIRLIQMLTYTAKVPAGDRP